MKDFKQIKYNLIAINQAVKLIQEMVNSIEEGFIPPYQSILEKKNYLNYLIKVVSEDLINISESNYSKEHLRNDFIFNHIELNFNKKLTDEIKNNISKLLGIWDKAALADHEYTAAQETELDNLSDKIKKYFNFSKEDENIFYDKLSHWYSEFN